MPSKPTAQARDPAGISSAAITLDQHEKAATGSRPGSLAVAGVSDGAQGERLAGGTGDGVMAAGGERGPRRSAKSRRSR